MPRNLTPDEWEAMFMKMILHQESGVTQIFNEFARSFYLHLRSSMFPH